MYLVIFSVMTDLPEVLCMEKKGEKFKQEFKTGNQDR